MSLAEGLAARILQDIEPGIASGPNPDLARLHPETGTVSMDRSLLRQAVTELTAECAVVESRDDLSALARFCAVVLRNVNIGWPYR